MSRKEAIVKLGDAGSGVQLTITRKGVEVFGWYDHIVGIEGGYLPWEQFDQLRRQVERVERRRRCGSCGQVPEKGFDVTDVESGYWCEDCYQP